MARIAKRLTKAKLDDLRRKAQSDASFSAYVADAGQPGLYAWARRRKVSFYFVYAPPGGGSRRRMKIDDFGAITLDQARAIAQKHRGTRAADGDPQEERLRKSVEAITLQEAATAYLEDLRQRAETGATRGKRSGYDSANRRIERNVLPTLGKVPIRRITSDQVTRLHRSMKERPVEANRTLTALSAVFGFADLRGWLPALANPCRYVTRYEETGERRALTETQLEALGTALLEAEKARTAHPSVLFALRFLALTGFRRAELLGHMAKARRSGREGLRWADVDLEGGLVRLRDSKTGAQTRVIGRAAIELLREARPKDARPEDPVCPGQERGRPFVGIDRPRRKLYKAAQLENVDGHSLRHTFASIGAHVQSGRYAGFVGPLLGHGYTKRQGVTDRYIHSNPDALRPAADAIAEEIARRLRLTQGGKVVPFPAQAADGTANR